jgi:hypothetical protein
MKIVINTCYGGFGLSHEAMLRYFEIKDIQVWPEIDKFNLWTYWTTPPENRVVCKPHGAMSADECRAYNMAYSEQTEYDQVLNRDDPVLIQVVEEFGLKASGNYAKLKIVEIPDDVEWQIEEYDGIEHIAELHRTWD